MMLDPLAERLGGDVDAAEELAARRRPGGDAAGEHGNVHAARGGEDAGEALGLAAAVVDRDDAHGAAREQRRRAKVGDRERARDGPEEVRTGELALLAGIEDGKLAPVGEGGAEIGGFDRHGARLCGARRQVKAGQLSRNKGASAPRTSLASTRRQARASRSCAAAGSRIDSA